MKNIYLIGNPNVGKSTLFNSLTGEKEKTGNYAGTTIQSKTALSQNKEYRISDLAGMYSCQNKKGEESIAWKNIESVMGEDDTLLVQVINAGEWKKSLSLTLDLQEKGIHPILFFNTKKTDKNLGNEFYKTLATEFFLPVFWGDIEEGNFPEIFWKKFQKAEEKSKQKEEEYYKKIPHTFSSVAEKESYINDIFSQYTEKNKKKINFLSILDRIFLHSFFGLIVFFTLLYIVFELTFTAGAIPMDWIDGMTSSLQEIFRTLLGTGLFSSLIVDGAVAGVGGTLIFLPNIVILFFFLSLLKESGYLARTSFLFDAFFQKIGISGKASVPLLMGFGCNVPAIMMIKSFETRKEQVMVAMMTLFMSCGARLPVYALLIAAFIPAGYQGATLFAIYILGIVVSFMTGKILNRTYKRGFQKKMIAYEMPTLVFPSIAKALQDALTKGISFIKKAGVFILPVSIFLWALFTFPQGAVEEQGIESSYGATIGKTIQPVFGPMGFDWKISTALLSGVAAKEVMVTTFAELYHAKDEKESLTKNIKNSGVFTLPVALALIIFVLLYTPCLAVVGVIRAELGNLWAGFSIVYPFIVAWIFSYTAFILATYFTL